MHRIGTVVFAALAGTSVLVATAAGDVFELKSGGTVTGTLQNSDQSPRKTYVVKTESGNVVTIGADQVRRVRRRTPLKKEYDRRRTTSPDTVDGHWQLADWCSQNRLVVEQKAHLRRIVTLDPDHAEARRLLGFRRVDGAWMSRDDEMQSRGLVKYEGKWWTPQHAEILERSKRIDAAEDTWRKNIKRWRGWLDRSRGDKADDAQTNILAADDPHAAPALLYFLKKEKVFEVKLLLLEALSDNPHPEAVDVIAEHALESENAEIRRRCIGYLVKKNNPLLVRRFVLSLSSNENIEINRAAIVLGALGFPDAISPLIDALNTKHKIANPNAGRTNAGFRRGGGGGGFGTGGPKYFTRNAQNEAVRAALVRLANGPSFDYDEQAWRRWYTSSLREETTDMRRD